MRPRKNDILGRLHRLYSPHVTEWVSVHQCGMARGALNQAQDPTAASSNQTNPEDLFAK